MQGSKFFYKPCTSIITVGEESNHHFLKKEDFMIVLQTEHQKNLASRFADKGVCCDSTHGTNAYDFSLQTLLVVDEFGEGQPVGWCISNHENFDFVRLFFKHIKNSSGEMKPIWFMSDLGTS